MRVNIERPPKLNSSKKQRIQVEIEDHDIWSFDYTLTHIIVPGLELFRDKTVSAPRVDNEDVPEHLRAPESELHTIGHTDSHWNDRWIWILNEMIWAMREIRDDNPGEEQFYSFGEDKNPVRISDTTGLLDYHKRIQNGCQLFGKYFTSLWS